MTTAQQRPGGSRVDVEQPAPAGTTEAARTRPPVGLGREPRGSGVAAGRIPPERYRFRGALEVRARAYDGTRRAAGDITRWVEQVGRGRVCTSRGERDGRVLVVGDPQSSSSIELHPHEVLVWTSSSGRWSACTAEQFGAWFEPAPRELPIFPDGETAE